MPEFGGKHVCSSLTKITFRTGHFLRAVRQNFLYRKATMGSTRNTRRAGT